MRHHQVFVFISRPSRRKVQMQRRLCQIYVGLGLNFQIQYVYNLASLIKGVFMPNAKSKKPAGSSVEIINAHAMRDRIHYIRGQQVMLDYDLAEIYGYTTSAFNQQITRNIEKFEGGDFMFQLTRNEVEYFVISQNVISRNSNLFHGQDGGSRKLPYAFTEQGIYMLMTVLRGELAIKQSRALIRMFKKMKDYIVENQEKLEYKGNLELAMKVMEHTGDIK